MYRCLFDQSIGFKRVKFSKKKTKKKQKGCTIWFVCSRCAVDLVFQVPQLGFVGNMQYSNMVLVT